jgi:osmoprotectant transport system substrate-binding protein
MLWKEGEHMVRRRRGAAVAAAVAVAVLSVGCGKSVNGGGSSSPSTSSKATFTVGSVTFPESQIVAEMYAQVLAKAGYTVKKQLSVGQREILQPAMPNQIQVAPEYVGSLLAYLKAGNQSSDPVAEAAADNAALASKGLTVLQPSAANDVNAFVVTKATADKYHLSKVSDMKPVAGNLTLGGPPECATRPLCLVGLKNVYGFTLKFQPIGSCDTQTANALDTGAVQVALLCSSQAIISKKGWVVLDDDKKLQPADNIAPEVSTSLLTAHPDIKDTLNAVSAKLTTANIVGLNAQVEIDHKDAATVAQSFLKEQGLL